MKTGLVASIAAAVVVAACTGSDDPAPPASEPAADTSEATSTTAVTLPPDDTERAVVEGVLDGDSLRVWAFARIPARTLLEGPCQKKALERMPFSQRERVPGQFREEGYLASKFTPVLVIIGSPCRSSLFGL